MTEVVSRKPRGPPIADIYHAWRQDGLRYNLKQNELPNHFLQELHFMYQLNGSVATEVTTLDFSLDVKAEIEFQDLYNPDLEEQKNFLKPFNTKLF